MQEMMRSRVKSDPKSVRTSIGPRGLRRAATQVHNRQSRDGVQRLKAMEPLTMPGITVSCVILYNAAKAPTTVPNAMVSPTGIEPVTL